MSTPITSYGTITIVDLTDVGQYSVYPYANSSNTQIYSQENLSYSPNWTAQNPLIITPVITYAGEDKTTESLVKWYLKGTNGSSDTLITTIPAGTADKRLSITSNLTDVSYRTYIVVANYTSNTGAEVEARGEIHFNKLTQTSTSKGVQITGTNVFKYQTGSLTPTEPSIELTPTPQGEVGFPTNAWEYWDGTKWATTNNIGGLNEDSTTHALTVQHTSAAFINSGDIAKFKVTVNALYNSETRSDVFTITKLRDGAEGGSLIQIDLSNDDQMVPLNSEGVAQWSSIGNLAGTQIKVFEGNRDITANLGSGNNVKVYLTNVNAKTVKNFGLSTQEDGENLTPASTQSGYTMQLANGYDAVLVTGYTQDGDGKDYTTGNVRFVLTYKGVTYSKVFSLIGVEAGKDGDTPVVYALEFSDAVKRINNATQGDTQDSWTYYPENLDISAKSSDSTNLYDGAIWYKRKGDNSWTKLTNISTGKARMAVSSLLTVDKSPVLFRLTTKNAANANSYLDQESIIITSDGSVGKIGQQGAKGISALNVVLTNENQSIKITSDYKTIAQTLTTKYQGYVGTTAKTFTYAGATFDNGVPNNLFGTISVSQGVITIPVNGNVNVASYLDGSITFGFTYTETDGSTTTLYKKFTFDMNPRGENAVTLQLNPSGSTFFKNKQPATGVVVTPKLNNGSDIPSTDYTVAWTNAVTGADLGSGSTLTVTPNMVTGAISILCTATYPKGGQKTYTSYISFTDYDDPLQVQVICTLGETIVNGIGEGVIYALTTQAGQSQALDYVMPGIAVDDTLSGHTESQMFLLTKSNDKVTGITLKNKSGTTAGNYTNADLSPLSYSWSFRDIEGNPLSLTDLKALGMYISSGTSGSDNGQFVYINAGIVNKKLMCYVAVTKN